MSERARSRLEVLFLWAIGAAGLISAARWLLLWLPLWLAVPAIGVVAVLLTRAVDARVRKPRGR